MKASFVPLAPGGEGLGVRGRHFLPPTRPVRSAHPSDLPREGGGEKRAFPLGLLAVLLLLLPLIGHGCHGKDEDHEPAVVPTERAER